MKDLRAFPKAVEMYGDKSEESDKGFEVFSRCPIAMEIQVGCYHMSEASYHHILPIQNSWKTQVSHGFTC